MLQAAAAQYQKVQSTTSNQGELLVALYDGLFKFLRGSRLCIDNGHLTRSRELNSKAYKILAELEMALDPEVSPELCMRLSGLYGFCMDRLRQADRTGDVELIDEVIRVMTPLHEAWKLAVKKAIADGVKFGR